MARSPAVTTAATTTQPMTDPNRHATSPPAATPTVSAPIAMRSPSASAWVTTSAAKQRRREQDHDAREPQRQVAAAERAAARCP